MRAFLFHVYFQLPYPRYPIQKRRFQIEIGPIWSNSEVPQPADGCYWVRSLINFCSDDFLYVGAYVGAYMSALVGRG